MRRVLASLLLVLFSFSLIAPALFASDTNSKLPACCRRDGKHHCTQTTGSGFRAARCAAFPSISVVPAPGATPAGPSGTAQVALVVLGSHSSKLESRSRISYSQAGQKRGPPVLFS